MVNNVRSPRQRRRTPLLDVDTADTTTAGSSASPPDQSKKRRGVIMGTPRNAVVALRGRLSGYSCRPVNLVIGLLVVLLLYQLSPRHYVVAFTRTLSALVEPTRPPIIFPRRVNDWKPTIILPNRSTLLEPLLPDLGGLELTTLHHVPSPAYWKRLIDPNDAELFENDRDDFLEDIDGDIEPEFEHSEDYQLEESHEEQVCARNNWGWKPRPNCNNFHETAVSFDSHSTQSQAFSINYLSHGYYRDTWIYKPADDIAQDDPDLIFKTLRFIEDHDFDYFSIRKIEQEAVVMEGLTASNLVVDIYGHCSTSIIAEAMPGEITTAIVPGDIHDYDRGRMRQQKLDRLQKEDVFPLNNLTSTEKLDLALLMSESLAELHGFHGGVIIHGDLHPDQYLKAADGSIKLNDFNNGHLMLWSRANETYCRFWESFGGAYKAPEEFSGDYANESVDTWAIGHGIFGLLTGLFPYYNTFSHSVVRTAVMEGEKPFVDDRYRTRSMVEGRLVEIMEQCWEFEPDDRPEIFDVVDHLRETKRMYQEELANGGPKKQEHTKNVRREQVKQIPLEEVKPMGYGGGESAESRQEIAERIRKSIHVPRTLQ